jgi:hypothetical protein
LPVHVWNVDRFSMEHGGTLLLDMDGASGPFLQTPEFRLALASVEAVWMRRPMAPVARPEVHPDDIGTALAESKAFVSALLGLIPCSARWLNPRESSYKANNKLLQLQVARSAGFAIPTTVVTNEPGVLWKFVAEHRSTAALLYKGFGVHRWSDEQGSERVSYANKLEIDSLPSDELIAACPGIYQTFVEKSFEVRCVVWSDGCYAIKLHSSGRVDWRLGPLEELQPAVFDVPESVKGKCRKVLDMLGIAMGSFDFIVNKHGEFVFLEVNEQGQFLFMEEVCPELRLLDGFCRFVAGAPADAAPHVRLDEVAT